MKIVQIVLVFVLFTSCNFQKASEEKAMLEMEALNKKELESTTQSD